MNFFLSRINNEKSLKWKGLFYGPNNRNKRDYHSLSVEQYKVTPELIEHVKTGDWDAKKHIEGKQQRDVMAARGNWLTTKKVIST